jgi:hypothetical protein
MFLQVFDSIVNNFSLAANFPQTLGVLGPVAVLCCIPGVSAVFVAFIPRQARNFIRATAMCSSVITCF